MLEAIFQKKCTELKSAFVQKITSADIEFETELRVLDGILVETLIRTIDEEIIRMTVENMEAQKKKCAKRYDKILLDFENSIMDEKLSNMQGSKIYINSLKSMESEAKVYDSTIIDEFIWKEVRKNFTDTVVGL